MKWKIHFVVCMGVTDEAVFRDLVSTANCPEWLMISPCKTLAIIVGLSFAESEINCWAIGILISLEKRERVKDSDLPFKTILYKLRFSTGRSFFFFESTLVEMGFKPTNFSAIFEKMWKEVERNCDKEDGWLKAVRNFTREVFQARSVESLSHALRHALRHHQEYPKIHFRRRSERIHRFEIDPRIFFHHTIWDDSEIKNGQTILRR